MNYDAMWNYAPNLKINGSSTDNLTQAHSPAFEHNENKYFTVYSNDSIVPIVGL